MMNQTESAILEALTNLDSTIKGMPTATAKPNLLPLFEQIDSLARELPKGTNPNLLHYLHRKSYQKARLLLEGQDPENTDPA